MKIVEENCDYKKLCYWLNGNYVAKRKYWEGTCYGQSYLEKRGYIYRKCLVSGKYFEYHATFEDMNATDWIIYENIILP